MRILGISGSLRRESHNSRLLRAAAPRCRPGWSWSCYDGLAAVPPYDEDADGSRRPRRSRTGARRSTAPTRC